MSNSMFKNIKLICGRIDLRIKLICAVGTELDI